MSQWPSDYASANGIRIHYHRTGGDKPPLVLAHGASDSGLCWTRVAKQLEADYDVIMPDARGHGLSEAPESGYANTDHAQDLAGLIHELNLSKPALMGHSMGAATTLRLIADYPDLASCAILEDPPMWMGGRPMPQPGRPNPREDIRKMIVDAQTSDLETVKARGRAAHPSWAEEEFEPWADAKKHVRPQFVDWLMQGPTFGDWRAQFARVTVPTLLVTSDPELGGIVAPEAAEEASRIQPRVQVVRLRGAGHNIRREQFDAFTSAIRAFLAAHARASALTRP